MRLNQFRKDKSKAFIYIYTITKEFSFLVTIFYFFKHYS